MTPLRPSAAWRRRLRWARGTLVANVQSADCPAHFKDAGHSDRQFENRRCDEY